MVEALRDWFKPEFDEAKQQGLQQGMQQGIQQGMQQGAQQGQNNTRIVFKQLYDSGRTDDLQRDMTDQDYLNQLIRELCGKK